MVTTTLIMTHSPTRNFLSTNVVIKTSINYLNAGCAGKSFQSMRKGVIAYLTVTVPFNFSIFFFSPLIRFLYYIPTPSPLLPPSFPLVLLTPNFFTVLSIPFKRFSITSSSPFLQFFLPLPPNTFKSTYRYF